MYKIYINETPLILTKSSLSELLTKKDPKILVGQYDGKVKTLFRYIDQCEKSNRFKEVYLSYFDHEKLYQDFTSQYKKINAAGSIVLSEDKSKILMIFRRGMWDLPKGKIEKNESIEDAAKREVQEETGAMVNNLSKLCDTYHTYKLKGIRILKKSFWFVSNYKSGEITPQIEEDIEKIEWMTPQNALEQKYIYNNIKVVIEYYLKQI
jgi:8-oxo-dGTP pyrophosphatase MutT (NUDIX family)